jgi:hypothetical protein
VSGQLLSGAYKYYVDDVLTAHEPWTIERDTSGTRRIICVRDASQYGVYLTLNATINADGDAYYAFALSASATGPIKKSAEYRVESATTSYRIMPQRDWKSLEPVGAIFFPLMRVFTGEMVLGLERNGPDTFVIVPSIERLADIDSVFEPVVSQRSAVSVSGQPNSFDLTGGAYQAPTRVLINQQGLLESYNFTDAKGAVWTCQLEMKHEA